MLDLMDTLQSDLIESRYVFLLSRLRNPLGLSPM